MATEYKLSYTASEINNKLGKIDRNEDNIDNLSSVIADKATFVDGVIKFFKTGKADELFSVDLSEISGGLDLANLTMQIAPVDNANRLTLSDGTTTKSIDIPIVNLADEQISGVINTWLDEHPEATTTVADGSIGEVQLSTYLSKKINGLDHTVNGGLKTLPLIIEEGMENYEISGQNVFAVPKDNLFESAITNNTFDIDTMTFTARAGGRQLIVPFGEEFKTKKVYATRRTLLAVGTESYVTVSVGEVTKTTDTSFKTQFVSGIAVVDTIAEIDFSQYSFTSGCYPCIIFNSANYSEQGNIIGTYIGEGYPTNMIAGEYTGDATNLVGYKVYNTEGTEIYQSSIEENMLKSLEPVFEVEETVAEVSKTVNGDYKNLPFVITEEEKDFRVSGKYVFATPQDNLLDNIYIHDTNWAKRFDAEKMQFTQQTGGRQFLIPITEELKQSKLYACRRSLLFKQDSANSLAIFEYNKATPEAWTGPTKTIVTGINWYNNDIVEIDLSQYSFTDGYYAFLCPMSSNYTNEGAIIGMYIGEEYPTNMIAGEYYGTAENLVGYKVYNTDGTEVGKQGAKDSIGIDMPSRTSVLIVNKASQLEKMEKPYSFTNRNLYLDNGENEYFCWNHNKLHYDKTLHKFVYICKNKSTHTSSGDKNAYMYLIDPSNPSDATPQKIYVGENQITWLQGFAILEDGTWLLADCDVENHEKPQMIVSRDNGSTFEILCEFVPPVANGYFNSISVGFNGRIFGAYDDGTVKTSSSNSHIAYSDDNGQTWYDIEITGQKFVEQLILPISETRLALLGRYNAYGSSEQKAVTAYSDDNGLTWTFFNSAIKMHSNDCAGFVHNGLIELFALERYYTNSFRVGDKAGQLTHYIGSAEDFVNDNMIEYEVHYLSANESADLGHPSACLDEYGNALVITSANHDRVKNNTYPLMMFSDNNRNPV